MAPFFSRGGYSSESLTIALSVEEYIPKEYISLQILQQGDLVNQEFIKELFGNENKKKDQLSSLLKPKNFSNYPPTLNHTELRRYLRQKRDSSVSEIKTENRDKKKIFVICHSEAGSWNVAGGPKYQTLECPIDLKRWFRSDKEIMELDYEIVKIGRIMFETDRFPSGWLERLNEMDELWVPTEFTLHQFKKFGVTKPIRILTEPVDTDFFNPKKVNSSFFKDRGLPEYSTIFESVFKLEERKGWKILLKAYFNEFKKEDNTLLAMVISAYHLDNTVEYIIDEFIQEEILKEGQKIEDLPKFQIFSNLSEEELRNFYGSGDVFVLPTRGEGFGRPYCESMSMGVPIIATNWSGPTAFMKKDNSYMLQFELISTESFDIPWKDHFWANPNINHLRELLRFSHENPEDVKKKGKKARELMKNEFSMKKIGYLFFEEFQRLIN